MYPTGTIVYLVYTIPYIHTQFYTRLLTYVHDYLLNICFFFIYQNQAQGNAKIHDHDDSNHDDSDYDGVDKDKDNHMDEDPPTKTQEEYV